MSFNTNDTNAFFINRTNYEGWFLLYVDDEVTAEERLQVQAFAAANPDLQAELNLLLSTKIVPEEIAIHKEDLLACKMEETEINQDLLLYIDNEVNDEDKTAIEHQLTHNAAYQLQYALLQKTKLDASEKIVFPNKKSLYRKPAFVPVWNKALRLAAGVIISVGVAFYSWFQFTSKNKYRVAIIQQPVKPAASKNHTAATTSSVGLISQKTTPQPSPEKEIAVIKKEDNHKINPIISKAAYLTKTPIRTKKINASTLPQQDIAINDNVKLTTEKAILRPIDTEPSNPQKIYTAVPVTITTPDAYTIHEAPVNNTDAPLQTTIYNSKSKSALKGFLRKATHFIERTTNINPVNDNDELLIGAVSLKLK